MEMDCLEFKSEPVPNQFGIPVLRLEFDQFEITVLRPERPISTNLLPT